MTDDGVIAAATMAEKKWNYLKGNPLGYFIHSAMAGVYVGFGIILIFAIGAPLSAASSPFTKLAMGVSFGVALSLVIFAGSELFTGNNLIGVIGGLSRSLSWSQVVQLNAWSWFGNLAGSMGLAWLIVQSGVFAKGPTAGMIQTVAGVKMSLGPWELFVRGILCNWLICLAVWTAGRTTNDAAKIMLIFWCLFAFIGIGFEHSIANQSFLGMALFMPHEAAVSWAGFWYNQLFVALGNIVGGGLFVGGLYWLVSPYRVEAAEPGTVSVPVLSVPAGS